MLLYSEYTFIRSLGQHNGVAKQFLGGRLWELSILKLFKVCEIASNASKTSKMDNSICFKESWYLEVSISVRTTSPDADHTDFMQMIGTIPNAQIGTQLGQLC